MEITTTLQVADKYKDELPGGCLYKSWSSSLLSMMKKLFFMKLLLTMKVQWKLQVGL